MEIITHYSKNIGRHTSKSNECQKWQEKKVGGAHWKQNVFFLELLEKNNWNCILSDDTLRKHTNTAKSI